MTAFEGTIQQWRAGERLVTAAAPEQQPAIDRVCDVLVAELRRRLGSTFTTDELVDLYERGTSWCFDVATRTAPRAPWAWDARVFDAAFARYVREAADFAGGRRLDRDA
jgi:hypothetical protein